MTNECYSNPCPHLRRDSIDNPILLAALDIADTFLMTANRMPPAANLDFPSLFDHYATSAMIAADCDFACQRMMIANISLDDELSCIALMIHYYPDDDATILHIALESDTNLDIIYNRDNPDFDPYAPLR